ncbi:MAG: hypothetical protein RRZ84_08435 [Romboutsia sp.]
MEKANVRGCADAGTKYCPCHLAYSGDCIKCSLNKGKKTCDCLWQGVCIYNEIQHNGENQINEREEYLCNIVDQREIQSNIFLIKIEIPKIIAKDLCKPGAYVLLKSKDKDSDIFNAPISVMDVDVENNILEVIIKPRGIKTKPIVKFDSVRVKGPYFNGVFGLRELNTTYNLNCVVILNGLSQVNSIKLIRKLIENKNHVEVFIDTKAVILNEVVEKIMKTGANIHELDIRLDEAFILDYIRRNDVKLVYSGGHTSFNKYIMNKIDSVNKDIKLVIPNNNLICCGEGVCGACTVNLNGERVKSCKTQIDSRDYLNKL